MRVIKPAFVLHQDDKERPGTIFSLSVHPDGSRLATGGLDTKIKVWSTISVMNEDVEDEGKVPKLLSTLTTHSGVVMCVRWSNSGSYLASGSDDNIVIVWNLDSGAGGKVWGTEQTNVENWKAVKRLVGHDSDVAGVAWNSDDSYLASVGLDSTVMVWSGASFDLIRRLDGHQGFVKGVVWDPVGQYLATQSDDRTLRIWRTEDWGVEAVIDAPFKNAPVTTITRLSWSPEGTHVVSPNSMNGPVFVAAVIERQLWKSNNSMVGHENVIEVTAFNPLIFLRDPNAPASGGNLCTILALSARNSISLWVTSQSKPLVVLDEIFDRDVLDMSWSADGLSLWSCSSEGHVAVFNFDITEFVTVAPPGTKEAHHATYNFRRKAPIRIVAPSTQTNGSQGPAIGTLAKPNVLVSRKGPGAKRVSLKTITPVVSNGAGSVVAMLAPPIPSIPQQTTFPQFPIPSAFANSNVFSPSPLENMMAYSPQAGPSNAVWGGTDSRKRKADGSPISYGVGPLPRMSDSPYRALGHTLGENRELEEIDQVELRPSYLALPRVERFKMINQDSKSVGVKCLAVPAVLSRGEYKIEDGEGDTFVWRNLTTGKWKDMAEIAVVQHNKPIWMDYLPKYVVCATGSPEFAAISTEDGALNIYSPTGRRLLPTMILDSPCAFLVAEGKFLMAITAMGSLAVWDTILKKSMFPPLNVSTLLTSSSNRIAPQPTITTSAVLQNGAPLIALSSGSTHSYDADLSAWIKLSGPWWGKSDLWEGRRGGTGVAGRGIVRGIESAINDILVDGGGDGLSSEEEADDEHEYTGSSAAILNNPNKRRKKKSNPVGKTEAEVGNDQIFRTALTLGHLEAKMVMSVMTDSSLEYKAALTAYTKRLADDGLRGKAEELIRDLMGPIYYKPGKEETWSPTVLTFNKRDLLRDVLSVIAKSKHIREVGIKGQELLKNLT